MSTRMHQGAQLEHWHGPRFPMALQALRTPTTQPEMGWSKLAFEEALRDFPQFASVSEVDPTTSDGYQWYAQINFVTDKATIALLMPWAHDWDEHGGSPEDRSAAVYVNGGIKRRQLNQLLLDVSITLQAYMNRHLAEIKTEPGLH